MTSAEKHKLSIEPDQAAFVAVCECGWRSCPTLYAVLCPDPLWTDHLREIGGNPDD